MLGVGLLPGGGEVAVLLKKRLPGGRFLGSSLRENTPSLVGDTSEESGEVGVGTASSVSGGECNLTKERPYLSFYIMYKEMGSSSPALLQNSMTSKTYFVIWLSANKLDPIPFLACHLLIKFLLTYNVNTGTMYVGIYCIMRF